MGMPMEFNTMIVTKGKEVRIDENTFELSKDGYRVYPIDIPIEVRKTMSGEYKTAFVQAPHSESIIRKKCFIGCDLPKCRGGNPCT